MNKVILIGRITKDIEVKNTSNGNTFCRFTVAVDRKFKDASGNKQTDFINCVAWRKTAELIGTYFKKGSRIAVVGALQTGSYEKDGQKVNTVDVVVDEFDFVDSRNTAQDATAGAQAVPEVLPVPPIPMADIDTQGVPLPFDI